LSPRLPIFFFPRTAIPESNYQLAMNETASDLVGAKARLAAAKAQLALSEAQLQRNQSDFQRTKTLATQGVSAQQELDHTTADLRSQQAMVSAQQQQVRAAEGDLKHAEAGEYRKLAAESAIESTKSMGLELYCSGERAWTPGFRTSPA
jgi:multidrug resistance efflux pump